METVKECIDRMIEPGQIMTIGRGSTKFVEVVSIERVPLTRNSIAVKERGDNYVFYISVDSLYFDNHYCGNCNGEGIDCTREVCKVCRGTGKEVTEKLIRKFSEEPKSVHYQKPVDLSEYNLGYREALIECQLFILQNVRLDGNPFSFLKAFGEWVEQQRKERR